MGRNRLRGLVRFIGLSLIALFFLVAPLLALGARAPGDPIGRLTMLLNSTRKGAAQIVNVVGNAIGLDCTGSSCTLTIFASSAHTAESIGLHCDMSTDDTTTLRSAIEGGVVAGKTLRVPSGCKILLGTPGSGDAVATFPSSTAIECEDSTAGFVLARHYCSGGATPGASCDGTGSDCPGGGSCVYDAGSSEFAPSSGSTYTVFNAASGAMSPKISGCTFWANQRSGNLALYGGDDSQYGYCSGGSSDTAACNSRCTAGYVGQLCNVNGDCGGGGVCGNTSHCATGGGTCREWLYTQPGGASGPGKIRVIDFDAASGPVVEDVDVRDLRTSDYAVRIGTGGIGRNIMTSWPTDPNAFNILFGTLEPNAAIDVGVNVKPGAVVTDSNVSGWTAAYRFTGGSGGSLFGGTVSHSIAGQLGSLSESTWKGSVGFLFTAAGNIASENQCRTFICGACEYGTSCNSNHMVNNIADGNVGPFAIVAGAHFDMRGNRKAWAGKGALLSIGEIRGRCSGGTRSGLLCFQTAGTDSTVGCPSSTCAASSDFKDVTSFGHYQISDNFFQTDQTTGISSYVSIAQSKRCTAGNSGASIGNPCSVNGDCGTSGVCGALTVGPGFLTSNFFYAIPSSMNCMDLSSPALSTSSGVINSAIFGNYCQHTSGGTGIIFPTTASQATNLRVITNSFSGATTDFSNWDASMGSLQFAGSSDMDATAGTLTLSSTATDFTGATLADYDNTYRKTLLNGCVTANNVSTGARIYTLKLKLEGTEVASTTHQVASGAGNSANLCVNYLDTTSATARTATLTAAVDSGTTNTISNRTLTRSTMPAS